MTTFLAWVCPQHPVCDQFGPYADRPTRCAAGHVTEAEAVWLTATGDERVLDMLGNERRDSDPFRDMSGDEMDDLIRGEGAA